MTSTRAYTITAEAVAREAERSGGNYDAVDISRILELDELILREVGPRDVRFKVLAVSAEHNIAHAGTADTGNIVEARGGKIYPGNSAVGEVLEVGGCR